MNLLLLFFRCENGYNNKRNNGVLNLWVYLGYIDVVLVETGIAK